MTLSKNAVPLLRFYYAGCQNPACYCAMSFTHYAECRYAEYRYAECHYAERRGALMLYVVKLFFFVANAQEKIS